MCAMVSMRKHILTPHPTTRQHFYFTSSGTTTQFVSHKQTPIVLPSSLKCYTKRGTLSLGASSHLHLPVLALRNNKSL